MATRDNIITEQVGKEIAIAYEKSHNREHIPFSKGEKHFGYDIRTFCSKQNSYRYIELKTSRKEHMINRWLEEHEQKCLQEIPGYYIYYILNIDVENKTGKVIEFSAAEWQKHYKKVERKYWYTFPKNTGLNRAVEIKLT
jgi:hypothetical protein